LLRTLVRVLGFDLGTIKALREDTVLPGFGMRVFNK
jgi:hypothetical protein